MISHCVAAGAPLERATEGQFYGDRSGPVRDPDGHRWLIGHANETVTLQKIQLRYVALFDTGR